MNDVKPFLITPSEMPLKSLHQSLMLLLKRALVEELGAVLSFTSRTT